ncbi:Nucleoid occlusion factor SlmA (plasmid) [Pseudoseohaeicola sp. NH-UV-7]|uniref:TetR/AcrR family transcriptional regulator n=1 Tax=unclassified Sulfitobacter TaxID=196795 RepID=UPI000E0BB3D9|nr:TetR/AcrR family transcriptional regulator [Sulfitobacter sp. JL08]AXI55498.1 hypothetical protein C1J05_14180 [Sulfitobacter sp. JL08]
MRKQESTTPKRASKGSLQATPERILDCARDVLIRQGYAKFTTRSVAAAVGISPGNLAYHFPSKQKLLQGVVNRMVADYSGQFEALLTEGELQPGQDVRSLVRWLLTDTVREETVRVFRELWAISLHDESTRTAIDNMYDELMAGVTELLKRSYPNVEVRKLQEVVQLIAFASEGSIALYGTRFDRAVSHEQMIDVITQLIDLYVPELGANRSK